MENNRAVLRLGAAVIAAAVFLGLLSTGSLEPLTRLPAGGWPLTALVFLQTGRWVRLPEQDALPPTEPAPSESAAAEPEQTALAVTAEALAYVSVSYGCDYRPDLESLLTKPLSWELRSNQPTVLILHSHATECYTPAPGESVDFSGEYRTLDPEKNMVAIGAEVARILREGGVGVIHDTALHDARSFNEAYASSREAVQAYLARYPSIRLVLDLHRDASGGGEQLVTAGTVNGQRSAQLMAVVGTDAGGSKHPNWQENLALALKLTAVLEAEDPGLCRSIQLRSQRFNQDAAPGSLIVEVGAAGNTRQEALLAAQALAQGILVLANGVNTS